MKLKQLVLLILLFISRINLNYGQVYPEGNLVINEISFGIENQAEYIEFVVLENATMPGASLNLENIIIDNHTDIPSFAFGFEHRYLAFTDCLSGISPGSIILIYNDTKSHPVISPANDGLPNQQGFYQIPISSNCLQGRKLNNIIDYSINETPIPTSGKNWQEFIGLIRNGDALQIRSSNGELTHSVSWGQNDFPLSEEIISARTEQVPNDNTPILTLPGDDCLQWYGTSVELGNVGSPGLANSPSQSHKLSNGTATATPFFINCTQLYSDPSGAFGAGNINLFGGNPPYIISWEGPQIGEVTVYNQGNVPIENLAEGIYSITVTDNQGCNAFCSLLIDLLEEDTQEESICEGDCIDIGEDRNDENICYDWEPAEEFDDPSQPIQNVCPDEDMTYTVKISSNDGDLLSILSYSLSVHERSEISLKVLPGNQGLCNFPVNIEATEGFVSYDWSGGTTGPTPNTIEINTAAIYSVTATDINGCTSTASIKVKNNNVGALAIKGMLEEEGFYGIPITAIEDDVFNPTMNTALVEDYASLNVKLQDDLFFNVADYLNVYLEDEFYDGFTNKKSYVSKNENFCNESPSFDDIKGFIESREIGIWAHVWQNPDALNSGMLYVIGKSPTTENGLAQISEAKEAYFNYIVLENPTIDYFPTKDEEIIYAAQELLTNFYIGSFALEDVETLKEYDKRDYRIDCNPASGYDIYGLTPAGVPVHFGTEVGFIYLTQESLDNSNTPFFVDASSIVRFYQNQREWRGMWQEINGEYTFMGYRKVTGGGYKEFPSSYQGFPSIPVAVQTAPTENTNGTLNNWIEIYTDYIWSQSYPNFASHYPYGRGSFQLSAYLSPLGIPSGNFTLISYPANLPEIKEYDLESPHSIRIFDNDPASMMYKIPAINGQTNEAWIFARFIGDNEYDYYIYDCRFKIWRSITEAEVDPTAKEEISFYHALFLVMKESGHTALDIVGVVPLIGDLADGLNGAWYFYEGDKKNGLISLGSVGISQLTVVRLGPKTAKITNELGEAVTKILADGFRNTPGNAPPKAHIREFVKQFKKRVRKSPNKITNDGPNNTPSIATDLIRWIAENPKRIDSWKALNEVFTGHQSIFLWDKKLNQKVFDLMENSTFMNTIGDVEGLKDILKAAGKSPCSICGNVGKKNLEDLDVYLGRFEKFVNLHLINNTTEGASTMLSLAKNGKEYQIDALAQTFRLLDEGNITTVEKFEPKLQDVLEESLDIKINQVGDILNTPAPNLKLTELKSWKKQTIDNIPNNQGFINQTKAYFFSGIQSVSDDFICSFDKRKLLTEYGGDFADEASALAHIKEKYQILFIENIYTWRDEIIQGNGNIMNFYSKFEIIEPLEEDAFAELIEKIDNFSPEVYSFIKIE